MLELRLQCKLEFLVFTFSCVWVSVWVSYLLNSILLGYSFKELVAFLLYFLFTRVLLTLVVHLCEEQQERVSKVDKDSLVMWSLRLYKSRLLI